MRRRYRFSIWRKPRLFLTLAAISLLLSLTFSAALFSTSHPVSLSLVDELGYGPKFYGPIPLTAYGWLSILSVPTVIAAYALFSCRKFGIFVSLAILPLLAFTLGMSLFFALQDSEEDFMYKLLIDLSIAAVLTTLGPLMLGWKNLPRMRNVVNISSRRKHS